MHMKLLNMKMKHKKLRNCESNKMTVKPTKLTLLFHI